MKLFSDEELAASQAMFDKAFAKYEREFERWYYGDGVRGPSLAKLMEPWVPPLGANPGPSFQLIAKKEKP